MSLRIASCLSLLLGLATVASADSTRCADGTRSAETGRGTCSHHGGEKARATKNTESAHARVAPHHERGPLERKTRTAPWHERIVPRVESSASGGTATARCRDGSLSYSQHHAGSCSDHGGVAAWIER